MHTLAGLAAGLTFEDIENLVALRREHFTEREMAALSYARKWAEKRGKDPGGRALADLKAHFDPWERIYILKILRMMKLANYTSNTLFGVPFRPGLSQGGTQKSGGLLGRVSGPVEGVLSDLVLFTRRRAANAVNRTADTCTGLLGLRCSAA